uniref:ATP synthase F0 subunit 6 n=1 Tax=Anisocentropus kawamurai TaxID=2481046 RepID=UPI0022DCE197|nr:ATP synthase F0 subunit 6 [Anisocentropus kawamurai]UZZ43744.1 ATP synthase F0 subunit 6 [Anisocentropus kawamurai]
MMANLFSIFDPSTNIFYLSLNWLSGVISCLLFLPIFFWLIPSRLLLMYNKIIITLHQEFKLLSNLNSFNGSTLLFISLFSMIFLSNLLGLFPYIFTSTSHLTMTLTLALPLWLSFMIFGWINNTNHMFTHLIPQNTPNLLMPFMVMIESISILIRPITLSIRLMANMIAGHLLITLMSKTGIKMSLILVNFLILSQILLLTLESAVAIIQAYVFSILSNLYSNEVN